MIKLMTMFILLSSSLFAEEVKSKVSEGKVRNPSKKALNKLAQAQIKLIESTRVNYLNNQTLNNQLSTKSTN
jgi:hypothetical protein